MIKIAITGANGRMGRLIMQEALKSPKIFQLVAAVVRKGSHIHGDDISKTLDIRTTGIQFEDHPEIAFSKADVVVDFSEPAASLQYLAAAQQAQKPILIGTTGFSTSQRNLIINASGKIPILLTPNTSPGITVMQKLLEDAAKALGLDYDVEIIDIHHNAKKDSPSGTALALAGIIAKSGDHFISNDYHRDGERTKGAIGINSLRAGAYIGEHDVLFASKKECLKISHQSFDRSLFAEGALKAAEWLKNQSPGLYNMRDVLGLS